MAFTAYRNWVVGETLTAALLNAQIRDNGNLTPAALATTKGDTFVATAANAVTRLGVGSDGRVLVADSAAATGVRWSNTGKTATAGAAIGIDLGTTLTAAANSDLLFMVRTATSVIATGTYTGLTAFSLGVTAATKTGTGTIDNYYGVYIDNPTIGTTNWPLYVDAGNVRLGTGVTYINDTSNANMTTGMTINQGAADDAILALKSSDVAHGITSRQETDTYANFYKAANSSGGFGVVGYTGTTVGIELQGYVTTEDATRSTAATGAIRIVGATKSGTDVTTMSADKNVLVVVNASTTRFILDSDGDSHQDVGTAWTNFDTHDDAELLTALSVHVSRGDDPIKKSFGKFLSEHRAKLEELKLVTFNDDGHHFVNMSKLTMLLVGAVRQQAARWEETAARLVKLETRLLKAGV